ncbi:MAG TPA: hypothetical protein VKU36_05640 [Candidatus Babeliales bacterium]|nr:hypothetical protein [Candidatus Babeliales bacterium]
MKSFKNVLAIVAIFTVVSMNAKQMGANKAIATPSGSIGRTQPSRGITSSQNLYQQLSNHLSSISEENSNFTQSFVNSASKLSAKEREELVNAAMKMFQTLSEDCLDNQQDIRTNLPATPFLPKSK